MYYAHWGLVRAPFAHGDAPLFFEGEAQHEALARLRFAAGARRHAVLLGERGVGKSLLAARYADLVRRHGGRATYLNAATLNPRELLWRIAGGLALGPRPEEDGLRLFRRLEDAAASDAATAPALLLVDDADQAGPDVRAQLHRLANLHVGARPWLTLALVATAGAGYRLGEALLGLIDLRINLDPWSESDATSYVQHALVEAGADRPVFDDEALSALCALSDGVPRRVNRLADHALLGAAAEGRETVDAAMIEAAHDALRWSVTPA